MNNGLRLISGSVFDDGQILHRLCVFAGGNGVQQADNQVFLKANSNKMGECATYCRLLRFRRFFLWFLRCFAGIAVAVAPFHHALSRLLQRLKQLSIMCIEENGCLACCFPFGRPLLRLVMPASLIFGPRLAFFPFRLFASFFALAAA